MQLSQVNTDDLVDAIRLGCRMMCRVFNADDNDIPFFSSEVKPNPRLQFSAVYGESHVPGRHLNALLSAEHAAGIRVDPQAIHNHANAAFFSYSGPLALPLNRTAIAGPLRSFTTHNVREGFHALYALVRYRDSERARQLAERSIGDLLELFTPTTGWDFARLERHGLQVHEHTFIMGIARAIGPLVKYYRATGYAPALQLATMLRDKAVAEFFLDSGAYDRASFGSHTHSTTCVMSSLAQLADLLDDRPLLERVKAFYDHGLWEIRDAVGWVIESSAADANPDRGEINNSGDVVETALILGRRGYPEYFEDAERITRCHILPSQLRDNRFITDPPNPEQRDGLRQVADRHLGGFGFPAPYGHEPLGCASISFNTDIGGGGVGSLCEVLREAVRSDASGHWVNLHFDRATEHLTVESPYTHDGLRITLKSGGPLHVRMPSWVDQRAVVAPRIGHRLSFRDGYLVIADPPLGVPLEIRFPLAERDLVLDHRTRDIRVRLRGDAVLAMENHGADLTFFDPL